jgi:integrase
VFPTPAKVRKVRHRPALPDAEVPALRKQLAGFNRQSVSSMALRFTILTAARTGEVIGMQWPELDKEAKLWVCPPERMKAEREHRVPLSDAALAIIKEMEKVRLSSLVFPGWRKEQPLSDMAMLECLRRLRSGVTVHGFRSSFRDWAGEETDHPHDICEAALAHIRRDKTHAAYQRGDLFKKRRQLMADWATFCGQ